MPDRDRLRNIKTFPSLVKYLRDDLNWPIDSDDFEERDFFDYESDELGIDAKTAAKIEEIKQLRPLTWNQPWGIFFLKFAPKRLPVVALRRVLSGLVFKKRATARSSEQAAWNLHDLLFISNYGEGDERQITFAHFSEDTDTGDLPTLKVLGWDGDDTNLHLDDVADKLTGKLSWPADESDAEAWRTTWASAFTLRHREVITTSKRMAERLAELARSIRKKAEAALAIESEQGRLRKLMKAFQQSLIHDLNEIAFADMYAQTIAYGLLSARVSRQSGALVADDAALMIPVTNPFLRELMETFLKMGGRRRSGQGSTGIDFDELGINDVVQTLRDANMEAVVRDFGDKNPLEDPVIHFYELFAKEYDPIEKIRRGEFYTPRPVVSYIVRSVHELLQTEFGLADGLADTATWGEMAERYEGLTIPDGVKPTDGFVTILDPATGTGTFLVEVIDVIHKTLVAKWNAQGHAEMKIAVLWNDYVPEHLLPRLHAYELKMAPYAIAHLKIGLKLHETGYRFDSDERARIYLTNALEPASDLGQQMLAGMLPALAHEAQAVNEIKRKQRFTVVIGNPPYSNLSANLTETARALIEKYKFIGGERVTERNALQLERNLNDDYVKFIAWSEDRLCETGFGILSMISNNVYTWSPSLRGMRAHLMDSFPCIRVLDLHGASQRGPSDSRFADDKNVFDIEQPVAIGTFCAPLVRHESSVGYADYVGTRTSKYQFLLQQSLPRMSFKQVEPVPPARCFVPSTSKFREYRAFYSLASACPLFAEGIKTGRDWLVTDFEEEPILERMAGIQNSKEDDDVLCKRIGLSRKKAWNFAKARAALAEADLSRYMAKLAYRPFDERPIFYDPDWVASSSTPVMRNLTLAKSVNRRALAPNLAILAGRISRDHVSRLYWCSRDLTDKCILSSLDNVSVFPALVFPSRGEGRMDFGETMPDANLSKEFLATFHQKLGLSKPSAGDASALMKWTFDIFQYFYAILWSPSYRLRYGGELSADFPRLPLTSSLELFRALAALGGELVSLHLMESPKLEERITAHVGAGNPLVERVSYAGETVWVDKAQTCGFRGVPEDVWSFHIGGYQVCEKWLKDRGPKKGQPGRKLTAEDIDHYHRIVVALSETIRIMKEIDEVIEAHGGWPLVGSVPKE